jgi:GR25 family glycosyltransferase involved in LPS biosynthesis
MLAILLLSLYVIYNTYIVDYNYIDDLVKDLDIYVINLEKRKNKKDKIMNEMAKYKLKANIFNGIDGEKLNLDDLEKDNVINRNYNKKNNIKELRRGEIGCSLSHFEVWKKLLKSDKNYCLILEDDAYFVDDFKNKLNIILNEVKDSKWDILYLNENCTRYFKNCDGKPYTKNTIRPENIGYGMYGYIIKKDFIKKCTDFLPIIYPVDVYLSNKEKENIYLRSSEILVNYDKKFVSDTNIIK